jgi:hypothetical protein
MERIERGGTALSSLAAGQLSADVSGTNDDKRLLPAAEVLASWHEMESQAPLLDAVNGLHHLVTEAGLNGWAGAELDGEALVLYWKGDLPLLVQEAIEEMQQDISIEVRAARYSAAEIDEEARRISRDPRIASVGALNDYSGLEVHVDVSYTGGLNALGRDLENGLELVVYRDGQHELLGRWNDISPFWSGSVMDRPVGLPGNYTYCSTAFAATRNSDTAPAMITSRHCGGNQEWHAPIGDEYVGRTAGGHSDSDSTYLTGSSSGYSPVVYVGPYTSNQGVAINGLTIPAVGTHVCYSGGFSGAVCDNTVTAVLQYAGGIGPGFWTENQGGRGAAGNGDSGGPVLAAGSGSGLNGIGVITIGDGTREVPCEGMPGGSTRKCFSRVFATNLYSVLSFLGLTLRTA